MRVTLTRKPWHKLLGVAVLTVDGTPLGWWNLREAEYLRDMCNRDPFALSVFLASRSL